ncbi:MAG TPA: YncE family protein [Gemmatimonadales bacterium]|nr:YncE family protein [Gemmatimonadales bacterium]
MPPLALAALFHRALPWLSVQGRAVISTLVCDNGRVGSTNLVCERLGLRSRFQLNRLLHREGLPSYEELAGWVCVLYWMLRADAGVGDGALKPIAGEAGMELASCYRLVRRVTGRRWTKLREAGTSQVMRWFVARTSPSRALRFAALRHSAPVLLARPVVCEPPEPPILPSFEAPRRLPIGGGPFDVAVRGSDLAYITRVNAAAIERLDLVAGRFQGSIHLGCTPTCVRFDASGARAYVSVQYCDEIAVIDTHRHTQIQAFPVAGNPFPLVLSARGHTLFVTTNEDRLFGLSVQNGRVIGCLSLPATSHHLALHPAGCLLYVATRAAGSVLEIDTSRFEVERTFALGGWPQGMVVSPDGATLYVANEHRGLDVVQLATGRRTCTLALEGGAVSLAQSPDRRTLYAGLVHSGKIAAIDIASLSVRTMIETGGRPRQIAFDGAGKIVIANEAGWVDILPPDGRRVYRLDKLSASPIVPSAISAS